MKLRNEVVFVDFLRKIEAGQRACDLVPPPFPDAAIRQLRQELAEKHRIIEELENRLNAAQEENVAKEETNREISQVAGLIN